MASSSRPRPHPHPHPHPPGAAAPETSSCGTAALGTASWGSKSIWSSNSTVTQQEFTSFHNIDRLLFTRLVQSLCRDMGQSMQVMALWLWLEKTGESRQLVDCMLKWPDTLVTFLADEAVLCLNCLDTPPSSAFPPPPHHPCDIPYTHFVTKSKVSLQFFRDNRLDIIPGITKIINEVCARAFEDIILQQLQDMGKNSAVFMIITTTTIIIIIIIVMFILQICTIIILELVGINIIMIIIIKIKWCRVVVFHNTLIIKRQIFNNEIAGGNMFIGGIKISAIQNQQQPEIIPQDQRTIFLTFSKGYPISETEIRDFISSKHGDCIEAIIMQERAAGEQPLYARLVLDLSCSSIEAILGGKSKAKFNINGKHVWARKYVRRNNEAPTPSPSPSSSQN
ncbi:hypothetical protein Dsin_004218 [Dipteronia sinensis]|uniref:Uncharacterized protein n=1 Tax=Dipteronia sinensis TaxID=43782 RepID=A0AAE0B9K7_9ROSI|nr:hypothetical protein Dsin_004218 [Dipteronia sinensis]